MFSTKNVLYLSRVWNVSGQLEIMLSWYLSWFKATHLSNTTNPNVFLSCAFLVYLFLPWSCLKYDSIQIERGQYMQKKMSGTNRPTAIMLLAMADDTMQAMCIQCQTTAKWNKKKKEETSFGNWLSWEYSTQHNAWTHTNTKYTTWKSFGQCSLVNNSAEAMANNRKKNSEPINTQTQLGCNEVLCSPLQMGIYDIST